jgi:DNA-binding CsgD family transcriptional regulator
VRPGSELEQFIAAYGTYDVVSIAFADRFGWWGFLDLWREGGRFSDRDRELVALLAGPVTTALRKSRAATFHLDDPLHIEEAGVRATPMGQAVLLLGPELTVRHQTPQAESDLRALLPTEESRRPVPAAAYNVAAQLLAAEAGIDSHRPMARTTITPGRWISVQAARLGQDIAVTLGPVEQRERWSLFCRAHGLSDRETQVVVCLAEGDDTHALAARLHLSEHTIQDHLKAVFAKTAVNSRRELLARARGA